MNIFADVCTPECKHWGVCKLGICICPNDYIGIDCDIREYCQMWENLKLRLVSNVRGFYLQLLTNITMFDPRSIPRRSARMDTNQPNFCTKAARCRLNHGEILLQNYFNNML